MNSASQLTEVICSAVYDGNTSITTESITEYARDAEEHVTIATRPLAIQKNGTWYTYGLDLNCLFYIEKRHNQ